MNFSSTCTEIGNTNSQNDIIWAVSRADIPEEIGQRGLVKHDTIVGVFLLFTSVAVYYLLKEVGESWDGDYFREKVITLQLDSFIPDIIPWLKTAKNVALNNR